MFNVDRSHLRPLAGLALLTSLVSAASVYGGTSYSRYCDVWYNAGGQSCQNNFDNAVDSWAKYSSYMTEWTYVPDYWHVRFDTVRMKPTVTSGSPVYGTYWITDNTNGSTYPNYDYLNKPLSNYPNGFSFSTFSRSVNYHPTTKPTSVFETYSASPGAATRSVFTHQNYYTIRY